MSKKLQVLNSRWKKFKNQARKDGLELSHWVKCYKDAQGNAREAEGGDYPFAKFNKKVGVDDATLEGQRYKVVYYSTISCAIQTLNAS